MPKSTTRKKRGNAGRESFWRFTILVIVLALGWWFRYWPEEHVVGKFFDALQKQDYKTAYGIWMHDPQWAAASRASIRNIRSTSFYQRLGAGRTVGTDQDPQSLRREHLPRAAAAAWSSM